MTGFDETGNILCDRPGTGGRSLSVRRADGQYLTIEDTDQEGLDLSGDFTVEAWVKPLSAIPPGQEYVIVSKWSAVTAEKAYLFLYYHDGVRANLRLSTAATSTSDDYDDANIPYTLPAAQWTHVAAVFTAAVGRAEYYVNGTSIGSIGGFGTSVNTSSAPLQIGTRNGLASVAFDGLLDEVRLWNRALTAQEIAQNVYNAVPGRGVGLVGNWRFECSYEDSSGHANSLTPVNDPEITSDNPLDQGGGPCW